MTYGWAKGSDRRWRRLRRQKLAAGPRCEHCLARGKHTAAVEVDHIIALAKGGQKYDDANLASLCHDCHLVKTTAERTGRIKGCDASGRSVDPDHPWNRGG